MKKFLSLMLVFVMVFALAACGSKDGGEDAKTALSITTRFLILWNPKTESMNSLS